MNFTIIITNYFYAFKNIRVREDANSITIPVFISALGSQYIHAFDQIAASGFIASACACLPVRACTQTGSHADRSLPPIILALMFQRFLIKGLTAGSTKG